ncbi:MAG: septum formation initiator family protein [Victivallales bacterium]|nr:septum formation initiator family protein [Victivallales bacterium]
MSFRELLFCVTLLIWTFGFFSFVAPISAHNKRLEEEIQALQAKQNEQKELVERLTSEYERLQKKDPVAIEKVLREKYNYCRDGETVVVFK